jgi:hypothetical protein
VRALSSSGEDLDETARLLTQILPVFLSEPNAAKYFRLFEEHGFHLTPVHFYQPIPDTRTLAEDLWTRESEMPGIEWNEPGQLDLLSRVFPQFRSEYDELPAGPASSPSQFHFNNGAFDGTDALVLYCMIRHFRPATVLEVGAGFSTRLSAQAALKNGNTRLVSIEPNPDPVVQRGFPGLASVITRRVQDVGYALFEELEAGDILFIDSSHVVQCGGDVNFLYLEVLPRLKPGVLVHSHDIFLPQEYPRGWVVDLRLFWTEQYLLQAFLAFNTAFEVIFANNFMGLRHPGPMREVFPRSPWWGGVSFWTRRKSR